MGVLDNIIQMKSQGYSDEDIANSLQSQGVSPREIQDAMAQAQIKNAVNTEEEYMPSPDQTYTPSTQEYSAQQYAQPQSQEYYPQEGYSGYSGATETDTMIEIAGQVFSEKIKKIQKQVETLVEFQTIAKTTIENLAERLKRIETTYDKLQLAVLDRVGAYGKDLDSMKKEIAMIESHKNKSKK